jgi:hypothetical protein
MGQDGVRTFHTAKMIFDGFDMQQDLAVSRYQEQKPYAQSNSAWSFYWPPIYENGGHIVRNFEARGFNVGISLTPNSNGDPERTLLVEDGILESHVNIYDVLPTVEKRSVIRNVQFEPVSAKIVGMPEEPQSIVMHETLAHRAQQPMHLSRTLVYDFDKELGNNFEVYWGGQAPDAVTPSQFEPDMPAVYPTTCPTLGLTNQQCWDQYGVALAGAIAPCQARDGDNCEAAAARAAALNIQGLVFPFTGEEPPPIPTVPPKLIITSPADGSTIASGTIAAQYTITGNQTNIDQVRLILDGGDEVSDQELDGAHIFENVSLGTHTLEAWLAAANGQEIEGTRTSITFETIQPTPDNAAPTISLNEEDFRVRIGETLTFPITVEDPDGDPVTITIPNLADIFPGATFE